MGVTPPLTVKEIYRAFEPYRDLPKPRRVRVGWAMREHLRGLIGPLPSRSMENYLMGVPLVVDWDLPQWGWEIDE